MASPWLHLLSSSIQFSICLSLFCLATGPRLLLLTNKATLIQKDFPHQPYAVHIVFSHFHTQILKIYEHIFRIGWKNLNNVSIGRVYKISIHLGSLWILNQWYSNYSERHMELITLWYPFHYHRRVVRSHGLCLFEEECPQIVKILSTFNVQDFLLHDRSRVD